MDLVVSEELFIFASMEMRQLRYFVQAAHTLRFTEAARLCCVAQSTLSQQIKQLEDELGAPLFHRVGRNVVLTAEGQVFLESAERVLHDAEEGLAHLADLRNVQAGTVRVGVATGLGLSAVVTETLTSFHRQYPKVRVVLVDAVAEKLEQLTLNHSVDMALTFAPEDDAEGLQVESLFATRLCAVVAEHHLLTRQSMVSAELLSLQPLALPTSDMLVRQRFDQWNAANDNLCRAAVEMEVLSQLVHLVAGGRWVTVLPDVASLAVRGLVAVPLAGEPQPMPVCTLTVKDDYQSKAVQAFMKTLRSVAEQMLVLQEQRCGTCGEKFMV